MDHVLINQAELYDGKYVAIRSFTDKEVICSGEDPVQVFKCAKEVGVIEPVVFYVPEKKLVHIY